MDRASPHADSIGRLAATWVRHSAADSVTDSMFLPSTEEMAAPDDAWTPLPHQHGATLCSFTMAVRAADGSMLGALVARRARVRPHCQLDAHSLPRSQRETGTRSSGPSKSSSLLPSTKLRSFVLRFVDETGLCVSSTIKRLWVCPSQRDPSARIHTGLLIGVTAVLFPRGMISVRDFEKIRFTILR